MKRRSFLGTAVTGLVAGCGRPYQDIQEDGRIHLRFTSWGSGTEWEGFERIVARYHALQPGVRVHLNRMVFQHADVADRGLAAGIGPDLLRVSFSDLGRYALSNALIDLTPYLPPGLADEFVPALWSAVLQRGVSHALPLHTDTSALLCNQDVFRRAGINLPQTPAEAWTWPQFEEIARFLKKRQWTSYGFGVNWTFAGAFRWLNFLYQRGGRLLQEDFRTPAILSPEAVQTMEWTRDWYGQGLTPASAAPKSGVSIHQLWVSSVVAMQFTESLTDSQLTPPPFPFAATFLPRDRAAACELGGTSIGITRDCRHPREAADFLLFLTGEESMRDFCTGAQFLPVRRSLAAADLPFSFRPDVMQVYREQAKLLPEHLARTVTRPGFNRVNRRLADELNHCFTGGQGVDETLRNIEQEVRRAIVS